MTLRPRAELAAAVGRDFEKASLPYFELVFPGMIRPPDLGYWDRRGVDLMTPADERPIRVCVQCKSTAERDIDGMIAVILADIDKFLKHRIDAELYIVALNRFDRGGAVASAVKAHTSAYAGPTRFEVWDRSRITREAQAVVIDLVQARVVAFNAEWREKLVGRFAPSGGWVRDVPLRTFRMMLDREGEAELRDLEERPSADAAALLMADEGPRISVLTGHFGAGKTSAALLASQTSGRRVLYVPASALDGGIAGTGSNGLTKEIGKALGVRPARGEADRVFLYLLGRGLSAILKRDRDLVLIIDGLDENRVMRGLEGLRRLRNQLNDTVCRVILSTRTAHLAVRGDDLAASFVDQGRTGRTDRGLRLVELRPWSPRTVEDHVVGIARQVSGAPRRRLDDLVNLLRAGQAEPLYGTLLSHPIFLDLILDDVAAEGVRAAGRADLVRSWIRRKIARDQGKYAGPPVGGGVAEEARLIFTALEDVALLMSDPASRTPTESLPYADLQRVLRGHGLTDDEVFEVLLKSVLVTLGRRSSTTDAAVMFSHRIFHEYMIAAALRRRGETPPANAPREVAEFWTELAAPLPKPASVFGGP